ncbi:MAG: hypothetical protein KUG65_00570 [Sphingomonadaceae bacterium]|nr:hypothetical protein [Sphingomonadaceae bacterium]
MSEEAKASSSRNGFAAGALITAAVSLLALPSAVLAFTVKFESAFSAAPEQENAGTLTGVDTSAALARPFAVRSLAKGQRYPFTPAGTPNRPDRSVTVAVRVDPETARAITARGSGGHLGNSRDGAEVRIAPTAFNLGVSRGYSNFKQDIVSKDKSSAAQIPDLASFSIAGKKAGGDSRFSPRIVMDETQSAGRSPRTFAGDGDDLVDVGGSYRVTKNLDVTAGVRYSQERERLLPVTDGKQDNQAVYVGTQFRF